MTHPPAGAGSRVVVIGGGHAAAALVGLLRQEGHTGEVVLVGDELDHPYHRPPLSKKFVDGELEQRLRPAEFYGEQRITVRLGEQAVAIDRAARTVRLDSGADLPYDVLVLATGARPRPLPVPGADLGGVGALRTLGDARALRKWIEEGRRLLIVGGGYIGLEVAAVARSRGVEAVVLEREERVLARVASPELSAIMTGCHTDRGTVIRTEAAVVALEGADGQVRRAVLDGGDAVDCDAVLVGVGALPRDELATAAGIETGPPGRAGILVDGGARTSDPAVLAIGDVTCRPIPGVEGPARLESIPSATEQAKQATATILGKPLPAAETPWFWSDQFDLKLKIAGMVAPETRTVLRGDPATGRFALFHLVDGRPVAVESANASPEFMAGKKWIGAGTRVDPEVLRDADAALRGAAL